MAVWAPRKQNYRKEKDAPGHISMSNIEVNQSLMLQQLSYKLFFSKLEFPIDQIMLEGEILKLPQNGTRYINGVTEPPFF